MNALSTGAPVESVGNWAFPGDGSWSHPLGCNAGSQPLSDLNDSYGESLARARSIRRGLADHRRWAGENRAAGLCLVVGVDLLAEDLLVVPKVAAPPRSLRRPLSWIKGPLGGAPALPLSNLEPSVHPAPALSLQPFAVSRASFFPLVLPSSTSQLCLPGVGASRAPTWPWRWQCTCALLDKAHPLPATI